MYVTHIYILTHSSVYVFCADFNGSEPPPHSKVLQWRKTLHYLARFVKQCNQVVLSFLHNLVTHSLKEFLKCFDVPTILTETLCCKQMQRLTIIRQQIQSKPNTTTVLSRYGPYENEEDPIPIAKFEQMCFSFPGSEERLKNMHYQNCELSPELLIEVNALWKADLKCFCENGERFIKIIPSLDEFFLAVSKTVSGFYKAVSNFTSLSCQDKLLPYITQTKYDLVVDDSDYVLEWPNVIEMKHHNNQYESTICKLLTNTFSKSTDLIEVSVYKYTK